MVEVTKTGKWIITNRLYHCSNPLHNVESKRKRGLAYSTTRTNCCSWRGLTQLLARLMVQSKMAQHLGRVFMIGFMRTSTCVLPCIHTNAKPVAKFCFVKCQ